MDGTEAWIGAVASAAVAGLLGLGRMWIRARRQASRERTLVELVEAGVPPRQARQLLRDTAETREIDDSTSA